MLPPSLNPCTLAATPAAVPPQDLKTNREHCGRCNNLCTPGFGCTNGKCDNENQCPNGKHKCNGVCVVSALGPKSFNLHPSRLLSSV
jgi:hypothetical protein